MFVVYILFSEKINRFYIGFTYDLDRRMAFHAAAENRKFTHRAKDWTVFFSIKCKSQRQGLAVEKHIKAMKSKTYINNLKKYPEMVGALLDRYENC